MSARHITSTGGAFSGTTHNDYTGSTSTGTVSPLFFHDLIDRIGERSSYNPLDITHRVWESVGNVSGVKAIGGGHYITKTNAPFDNQGLTFSHLLTTMPSDADVTTQTLARSNPSRPSISLPNFIYELKDLPDMLRKRPEKVIPTKYQGRVRSSKNSVAEANFAWLPLISDLQKLVDLSTSVDKRINELSGLTRKGGLKRRRTIFTDRLELYQPNIALNTSSGFSVYGTVHTLTTYEVWGSARWVPDTSTWKLPDGEALRRKMYGTMMGLGLSPGDVASVLWEALPWSWLVDYFLHVGTFLETTRNAVGAHPASSGVMRRVTTRKETILTYVGPDTTAVPGRLKYQTLSRRATVPIGSITFAPFIGTQQLTTLAGIIANSKK